MRSQAKRKYTNLKLAIWKILDDYTGAYIYSNEADIDYRGMVTRMGHTDQEPPSDHPVPPINSDTSLDRDDIV